MAKRTPIWMRIAVIVAVVVVPFGTLFVIAAAAIRARSALRRRGSAELEEWWDWRSIARTAVACRVAPVAPVHLSPSMNDLVRPASPRR